MRRFKCPLCLADFAEPGQCAACDAPLALAAQKIERQNLRSTAPPLPPALDAWIPAAASIGIFLVMIGLAALIVSAFVPRHQSEVLEAVAPEPPPAPPPPAPCERCGGQTVVIRQSGETFVYGFTTDHRCVRLVLPAPAKEGPCPLCSTADR